MTHKAEGNEKSICSICFDLAEDAIQGSCGHVFCRMEIQMYVQSSLAASTQCPACFRPLTIDLTQPALEFADTGPQAKVKIK